MGNYLNLEIKRIVKETDDTVSLILQNDNVNSVSFLPGQFLTFLLEDNGKEVRRGFSISSVPDDLPEMRVTIKKVHKESPSSHRVDDAQIGQVIKSLPPLGNFTVSTSPDLEREMIMFGAGSGITPLFSILKSILLHEPKSKVILYYGNRNESSIIFKDELDQLAQKYSGRLKIRHILSRSGENWEGIKGRITKDKTLELLKTDNITDTFKTNYFLCGPDGMMQNVLDALDEINVDHKRIHRENYEIRILDDNDNIEEVDRDVTIFLKGEKHVITVKPGESIQEKGLEEGLPIPFSCQMGECSTCKARLLSGKLKLVSQTALSEEEIKNGYCLTCVGYPARENVVILYEDPFDD